jgi:NAD-dependent DNA ligase
MSFLSEIIKELLKNNLVKNIELYTLKDSELIEIIKKSNNKKIQEMWSFYKNL